MTSTEFWIRSCYQDLLLQDQGQDPGLQDPDEDQDLGVSKPRLKPSRSTPKPRLKCLRPRPRPRFEHLKLRPSLKKPCYEKSKPFNTGQISKQSTIVSTNHKTLHISLQFSVAAQVNWQSSLSLILALFGCINKPPWINILSTGVDGHGRRR